MRHEEAIQQRAYFEWVDTVLIRDYAGAQWIHAIPNGERRDARTGALLKAMGVRAGILDIDVPIPRTPFAGLKIEMKSGKGRISDAQERYLAHCRSVGYLTEICRTWVEAARATCRYLGVPDRGLL